MKINPSRLAAATAALLWMPGITTLAQQSLPEPARVFTSKTALAVYLDLERSSQSGIWKTMENRLGPLQQQLGTLPQMPSQFSNPLAGLPDLQTGEVAELAIAIEGQNAFKNLETQQYDPDFSVLTAIRFKETFDQPQLLEQLLTEADKQKPGLRARLEQNQQRIGAIDWFELPNDALEGAEFPFPLSLAVGPGRSGSIVGIGKSEALRSFVAGQTDGRLPAGIGPTVAQRAQMWLYFPIPTQLIKELSTGADGANPMLAGLGQGIEKVREFGLGLSFGNNAIGLELNLGCLDAAAATELNQGFQQFLGLMQMMATQNPSAPKFIGRIRTATAGTAFRLSTDITMQDVELGLKSSGINLPPAAGQRPASGSTSLPSVPSAPAITPPPATVTFLELLPGDEQQLRYTRLRIDNRSDQPIKEIRVTFNYFDRAGRPIGKWTRRHQDPVASYLAPAKGTREVRCPTFHVPSTTDRVSLTLHEVVFADGRKWTP